MIFYNDKKPNSTVTSKKNNKRIALFKDGKFETNDKTKIEKLKKHFKFEESPKVISGLAVFLKLKKEAIEKGVYKKDMKKKDIEEALKEFKKKESE